MHGFNIKQSSRGGFEYCMIERPLETRVSQGELDQRYQN